MTEQVRRFTTDRIAYLDDLGSEVYLPEAAVIDHGGEKYIVARSSRDSGEFFLTRAYKSTYQIDGKPAYAGDYAGWAYTPVHPTLTAEDVQGATHAWDDGTHWHFAHTSEEATHDLALVLEGLTLAAFQPQIERATVAVFGAADAAAKTLLLDALASLTDFRNDVWKAAQAAFYAKHQGYYHQNPHAGHWRPLIRQAIADVKSIWEGSATRKPELPSISDYLKTAEDDLAATPTVKTRATIAAEAAAKAKKEAEEAEASEGGETA